MTKLERSLEATTPMPPFETLDEEAQFWDTHDLVDETDEGTVVGFHHSRKTDTLTIRFVPEDIQRIREEALQKGIGPTTLARTWILEHLRSREARR
jgi:predicted DNA binding CopG/RHH family protein